MKTADLLARLTEAALNLAFVNPAVVERDGVVSLRCGRVGLPGRGDGRYHVAYLGLARAGVRRLTAELNRVAHEAA